LTKDFNEMNKKFGHINFLLFGLTKYIIFITCLFYINVSYAETNKPEDLLEQYRQLLAEQEKKFEAQRQILNEQGKQLEQLRKQFDALSKQSPDATDKTSPPPLATTAADKDEAKKTPSQPPSGPVGQAPPQSKEPERPPEMPRLTETVGGVLTRKGNYVLEPALSYAFSSSNRVFLDAFTFLPAVAVGFTDIRQVKRHSIFASLGLRYGATSRLEVEARIPYVYRSDTQVARELSTGVADPSVFNADGNNIGDIELTARYQLTKGSGGWPILVGNMLTTIPTGKSPFNLKFAEGGIPGTSFTFPTEVPTGTGFFTFQPSVTALYPTAPAVFFGNVNYTYTMSTNENIGKIDAGDAVGMTFGMGFSVNNRTSFNLGYSHRHFFNTKINGNEIGGSALDIGQFLLGYSFRYSKQTNYNLSVGVGTTDNAQDIRLNFRVPMTF
jgi:hypothetical protein